MELLNHHVNEVNTCIVKAFHSSCKLTAGKAPRSTPWWNDHLQDLKRRTRRAANARKRKGDSGEYARILTEYSKEIRKAKRAQSHALHPEGNGEDGGQPYKEQHTYGEASTLFTTCIPRRSIYVDVSIPDRLTDQPNT